MAGKTKAGSSKQAGGSGSPIKKKKNELPGRKKKRNTAPTLTVYAFHETFALEAYIYDHNEDDGYTRSYRQMIDGVPEFQCSELQEANFNRYYYRRRPGSNNEILVGRKNYWRLIMIRYPPEQESTAETRQQGLEVLSSFLKNPEYTRFPPKTIDTIDATSEDNPLPLDHFFLDRDIQEIMEEDIEEANLNSDFFQKFPDFARLCWSGNHYSNWARGLGFP